eukprot:1009768-Rhodomonas_salina.4
MSSVPRAVHFFELRTGYVEIFRDDRVERTEADTLRYGPTRCADLLPAADALHPGGAAGPGLRDDVRDRARGPRQEEPGVSREHVQVRDQCPVPYGLYCSAAQFPLISPRGLVENEEFHAGIRKTVFSFTVNAYDNIKTLTLAWSRPLPPYAPATRCPVLMQRRVPPGTSVGEGASADIEYGATHCWHAATRY